MTTAQSTDETAAAGGPEHRASADQQQSDSGERHSLAAVALLPPDGDSGDLATVSGDSGGAHPMPGAELAGDDIPVDDGTDTSGFRYHIDQVLDTQIEGWIVRPDQVTHRYIVALREGDRVVARAIASRFRSDLVTAGLGDGCHAFVLPMPPALLDGEEHLLEVIEQETGLRLTAEPIRWRYARLRRADGVRRDGRSARSGAAVRLAAAARARGR